MSTETEQIGIDPAKIAEQAKKEVQRDTLGTPVHTCGNVSVRECQYWQCTKGNCLACMATLY